MSYIEMESITKLGNTVYLGITYDQKCLLSDTAYHTLADLGYDVEGATLMKIVNRNNGIYEALFIYPLGHKLYIKFSVGTELYKINNSPNEINNSLKTKSKPYASIWWEISCFSPRKVLLIDYTQLYHKEP